MFLDRELSPQIGQNVSLAIYSSECMILRPSIIKIKIDSSKQLFTEKIFRLRSNHENVGEKLLMLN